LAAPKFDAYGLHADDCECARCAAGHRPSLAQRWAARAAFERAHQRTKVTAALDTKDARKAEVASRTAAKLESAAAELARKIHEERELRARCRPLTDEEMNELRRENGLRPRRKGPT
jgi:hypothetical protein